MLLIYVQGRGKPRVFRDVEQAKRHVEEECFVDDVEDKRWFEHSDRHILTVRWGGTAELGVLWKIEE